MDNENNQSTISSSIIKIFKDSPSLLVIIIIVYIFTTTIGNKLDTINETLMEQRITNEILLERLEEEAEDTKTFLDQQTKIINKLDILLQLNK